MNPKLTAAQIRQFIHQSAVSDKFTGTTPNGNWGSGKLNVLDAANLAVATLHTDPVLSKKSLTFPATPVGMTSAAMTVNFSNGGTATDPLGITSIATSGDFSVASNNCPSSLPVGGMCTIGITFTPTLKGIRTGKLTIKDFNTKSPHLVTLKGTGT